MRQRLRAIAQCQQRRHGSIRHSVVVPALGAAARQRAVAQTADTITLSQVDLYRLSLPNLIYNNRLRNNASNT